MKKNVELKWHELKTLYKPSDFSFDTTRDLQGYKGIIGPKSAMQDIKFMLNLQSPGYNIYVAQEGGLNEAEFIKQLLIEEQLEVSAPLDICYVYNFKEPHKPRPIFLEAGQGKRFQDDMIEFVEFIENELPNELNTFQLQAYRNQILEEFSGRKEKILDELKIRAKEIGFIFTVGEEGIKFIATNLEGEPLNEEEFESLEAEQKNLLEQQASQLAELAEKLIQELTEEQENYLQKVDDKEKEELIKKIVFFFQHFTGAYKGNQQVIDYLGEVAQDLIGNLEVFQQKEDHQLESLQQLFSGAASNGLKGMTKNYRVNLFVEHPIGEHKPVEICPFATVFSLMGEVEVAHEIKQETSLMSIKAGALHRARGGYLILDARDLIEHVGVWQLIKGVLKTNTIDFKYLNAIGVGLNTPIIPSAMDANLKLILVGSREIYEVLANYDPEFKMLFKGKIEIEETLQLNEENFMTFANHFKKLCEKENLPPITAKGILRLVEYSARLAGSQDKLVTSLEPLMDLVREASVLEKEKIDEKALEKAYFYGKQRKSQLEASLDEAIQNNQIMIETSGKRIGQINGLAVYTTTDGSFGKPVKITVTTYKGIDGIVDIEEEAHLSGSIHSKGIGVIKGFLGQNFAQQNPLALACRICFEQSYGIIDGDSASSAELYAILSCLAKIAIKQNIAVTGSVNQHGQIQSVGGINEKIEGFFKTCKLKGLKGDEGVIIPASNKKDLNLETEVIEAVKEGKFHIYAIQTVQQGMELLTEENYLTIKQSIMRNLEGTNKKRLKKGFLL